MMGWAYLTHESKPSSPKMQGHSKSIKAKYDAAQTTADNANHWAAADSLSAIRANSPGIRRILRDRARYEVANNSYARGIVNSLASYSIGVGPTLALQYQGMDSESGDDSVRQVARQVEMLWQNWAKSRKIAQKLYTLRVAMAVDGEGFGLLVNRRNFGDPIELDLKLIEADQVDDTGMYPVGLTSNLAGVRVDAAGEPTEYAILPQHPGDGFGFYMQARWTPAEQVIHLYRCERAGQLRGIPEITPALELFAQLRRFTLATLTAAETAADIAAMVSTNAPGDDSETLQADARIEFERGAFLSMPANTTMSQLKAEHPNATYDEFVKAMLREIARCISIPAVVALGDASSYNYASGRLDLQTLDRQLDVDRAHIIEPCLEKIFRAWLDEALLIDGYLPDEFSSTASQWGLAWRWPGRASVDRKNEASGQEIQLRNNTTTLQREFAKDGLDWETEIRQRARETSLLKKLGLSVSASQQAPNDQQQSNQEDTADQGADANA